MLGARGESSRSSSSARTMPTIAPTTPSRSIVQAISPTAGSWPLRAASTSAITSAIATGSLKPASPSSTVATRSEPPLRPLQHREHGRGIGRRERGADDQRERPAEPGHRVRRQRDERERHERPADAEREHRGELAPQRDDARAQAAVDEDQHERDRARRLELARVDLVARGRPRARRARGRRRGTRAARRRRAAARSGSSASAASRITAAAARRAARDTARHGTFQGGEPPRVRDQPVPAAARRQPGRLVPVGRGGADAGRASSTGRSCSRSATRPATGAT